MPSHNLAQVQIDDLDIFGYSIAGEETVVGMPQLDVCFDIGKAPDQLISINHVLLTHGHMDHSAGFAYYLSQRNFSGMVPRHDRGAGQPDPGDARDSRRLGAPGRQQDSRQARGRPAGR